MLTLRKTLPFRSRLTLSGRFAVVALISLVFTTNILAANASDTSIKVHGDWVVTVTNPDGSVAQERSIQNALVASGKRLLVDLLTNQAQWRNDFGDEASWYIKVVTVGVDPVTACVVHTTGNRFEDGGAGIAATISDASDTSFTISRTLSLPIECVLNGTYDITIVKSAWEAIFVGGSGGGNFSEKTLSSPILGILPNQFVTLQVTFSFD